MSQRCHSTHTRICSPFVTPNSSQRDKMWNAVIDGAENVAFDEQGNRAQFWGEPGSISCSSPGVTASGSANFLQFSHTHAWTKKTLKTSAPSLPYFSLSESTGMVVPWDGMRRHDWEKCELIFFTELFATSVGGLCCCTGTPEDAKLFHPKKRLTRKG